MTDMTNDRVPDDGYATLEPRARAVLDEWFGAPGSADFGAYRKSWFARDAAFDARLRERYGDLIEAGTAGALDDWARAPAGALALVLVLDQFSRNCHRDTPRAFAADEAALRIARRMIEEGMDRRLPDAHHRAFAYLPFEHAESMACQRESLRLFGALAREKDGASYYGHAERHARVIERFGRFPHRNAVLGRVSSEEEQAFLRQPGSSF